MRRQHGAAVMAAMMAAASVSLVTGSGTTRTSETVGTALQVSKPYDGRQLFRTYCASCHGVTAQGNGPLAPALRRPPTDLTQMASKNGGMFPTERVRRIVDGREVESHGDPEMPVWGDAFKTSREGFSEESVRARIAAIVAYLESIQRRLAQ